MTQQEANRLEDRSERRNKRDVGEWKIRKNWSKNTERAGHLFRFHVGSLYLKEGNGVQAVHL